MSHDKTNPRKGHLVALYLIVCYLSLNPKKRIVMDLLHLDVPEDCFNFEFYGDVVKELPVYMPESLGNTVEVTAFVDSNHAPCMECWNAPITYRRINFCKQCPNTSIHQEAKYSGGRKILIETGGHEGGT
ncbi:hypothetical protein ACHAXS_005910 [Conticribra weissflogii]